MTDDLLVMPPALFPELAYIYTIKEAGRVYLNGTERFQKQTERSRYRIATAAGALMLTVPVQQGKTLLTTGEVRLSYEEPWPRKQLRAIKTAYGSAPYYLYFADGLETLLQQRYDRLIDLQMAGLKWLLKCFRSQTEVLEVNPELSRNEQFKVIESKSLGDYSYAQVFESSCGFIPGLSAIDYLFNEGPDLNLLTLY